MKPAYLVDTDWIIDHLNGKEMVRQKLRRLSIDCTLAESIF
jgi:hypothetical protein